MVLPTVELVPVAAWNAAARDALPGEAGLALGAPSETKVAVLVTTS